MGDAGPLAVFELLPAIDIRAGRVVRLRQGDFDREVAYEADPVAKLGEAPDAVRIPGGCRFHPRCPVAVAACQEIDPELRVPRSASSSHRAACILA